MNRLTFVSAARAVCLGSAALVLGVMGVRAESPPVSPAATKQPGILTPAPGPAPRINGPAIFGARPGSPFLYSIPATGTRPMTFAVQDLPAGLALDAQTGRITGTVNAPGEYRVTLRATNASGAGEKAFRIVIGDAIALTPPMAGAVGIAGAIRSRKKKSSAPRTRWSTTG